MRPISTNELSHCLIDFESRTVTNESSCIQLLRVILCMCRKTYLFLKQKDYLKIRIRDRTIHDKWMTAEKLLNWVYRTIFVYL